MSEPGAMTGSLPCNVGAIIDEIDCRENKRRGGNSVFKYSAVGCRETHQGTT